MTRGREMMPLLRRDDFLPDETLLSYVLRLAALNQYEPPELLARYICSAEAGRVENLVNHSRPRRSEVLGRLATISGTEVETLHAATSHRFAAALTFPGEETHWNELNGAFYPWLIEYNTPRVIRAESFVQWCPECLQEGMYQRVVWLVAPLAACEKHGCLLHDSCPECGSKVKVRTLLRGYCAECATELTYPTKSDVSKDTFGMATQRWLHHSLGLLDIPPRNAWGLPDVSTASVLHMIFDLSYCFITCPPTWSYFHFPGTLSRVPPRAELHHKVRWSRETTAEAYVNVATAMKALINWPESFYLFLNAFRTRRRTTPTGNLYKDFSAIYTNNLAVKWATPEFAFVQDAFNTYLRSEYRTTSSLLKLTQRGNRNLRYHELDVISIAEAVRLLRLSYKSVRELIANGTLKRQTGAEGETQLVALSKRQILTYKNQMDRYIITREAASRLDVSARALSTLAHTGRLKAKKGRNSGKDGHTWLFDPSELKALALANVVEGKGFCSVATMARRLMSTGVGNIEVLEAIQMGVLRPYLRRGSYGRLTSICVIEKAANAFIKSVLDKNGWLTREEVLKELGIGKRRYGWLIRVGALTHVPLKQNVIYVERFALEQFKARFCDPVETARLLGFSQSELNHYVNTKCFGEVGDVIAYAAYDKTGRGRYYLFDRAELLIWQKENHP